MAQDFWLGLKADQVEQPADSSGSRGRGRLPSRRGLGGARARSVGVGPIESHHVKTRCHRPNHSTGARWRMSRFPGISLTTAETFRRQANPKGPAVNCLNHLETLTKGRMQTLPTQNLTERRIGIRRVQFGEHFQLVDRPAHLGAGRTSGSGLVTAPQHPPTSCPSLLALLIVSTVLGRHWAPKGVLAERIELPGTLLLEPTAADMPMWFSASPVLMSAPANSRWESSARRSRSGVLGLLVGKARSPVQSA